MFIVEWSILFSQCTIREHHKAHGNKVHRQQRFEWPVIHIRSAILVKINKPFHRFLSMEVDKSQWSDKKKLLLFLYFIPQCDVLNREYFTCVIRNKYNFNTHNDCSLSEQKCSNKNQRKSMFSSVNSWVIRFPSINGEQKENDTLRAEIEEKKRRSIEVREKSFFFKRRKESEMWIVDQRNEKKRKHQLCWDKQSINAKGMNDTRKKTRFYMSFVCLNQNIVE